MPAQPWYMSTEEFNSNTGGSCRARVAVSVGNVMLYSAELLVLVKSVGTTASTLQGSLQRHPPSASYRRYQSPPCTLQAC